MVKYEIIYADPPWKSKVGYSRRIKAASRHYDLLETDYIANTVGETVKAVSKDGSMLFLWAVNNLLPDAFRVMGAWGYTYKTNFVWVKDGKVGTGFYNRGHHEILLLGVKGSLPYTKLGMFSKGRHCPSSLVNAVRRKHSQKPDEMYPLIEGYSKGPYLEIFARQTRAGWDSWGNELGVTL